MEDGQKKAVDRAMRKIALTTISALIVACSGSSPPSDGATNANDAQQGIDGGLVADRGLVDSGSRDSAPPPLDSVRDVIAQQVSQQKFQEFLSSLRSSTSE